MCRAAARRIIYTHSLVSLTHSHTQTVTVPVAPKQRVLRYGDMEYVMLHLIFIYLRFRQADLDRGALIAIEC